MVLALVLAGARHAADGAIAVDAAATAARVAIVSGADAGERAGREVAPGRVSVHLSAEDGWWIATATLAVPGPLPDAVATARSHQP
jgi:hypothetical protein